jgi:membrane-bound inhibitor of C-type lysozyme
MRLLPCLIALFSALTLSICVPAELCATDEKVERFHCDGKKWIDARFFEEPVPYVALELSDGRKLNLAQALAASGVRYVNVTETIQFWNKGRGARLEEGPLGEDKSITFACEDR